MRLFAQKGYGSTSVADILQAAGVNAGSLYYLYPGKQDVLLDVLDTYLAGIHPMLLAPAWEGISDPIERVFALLRRYRSAHVCRGGRPRVAAADHDHLRSRRRAGQPVGHSIARRTLAC